MLGVTGLSLRVALPGARVGDVVIVHRRGGPLAAEVVGFEPAGVIALPLGDAAGVGPDDAVEGTGAPLEVVVGEPLLGRVLDGLGRPLDASELPRGLSRAPVDRAPPPALSDGVDGRARAPLQAPSLEGGGLSPAAASAGTAAPDAATCA